ncbi:MAG: LarC family nickel insertion protein [Candidatus Margulisbacteria bacterium]|nr:LarC family nickel insertion protein [Candidatus Margulisiibacteriota bacterium]
MKLEKDIVIVLETNIDDMSPLFFEQVEEQLFNAGALDVWIEHIQMKKNRPAFKLSCIAPIGMQEKLVAIILEETTTSGVRFYEIGRYKLPRKEEKVKTSLGEVSIKIFTLPSGKTRKMPEYDDVKIISMKKKIPLKEVYQKIISEIS